MLKIIGLIVSIVFILSAPFTASAKSYQGTITSSGIGTVKVKPNGSKLYVSVKVFNKSHKTAYTGLLDKVSKIANHFKKAHIKTTIVNIYPNSIYKKGKWITDGYNASESLIIKIHGVKNTNNAILYLLKHKSVSIDRITPTVSNMEAFKIEAVRLAYKHAILKIKSILRLLNIKSYAVKTVNIQTINQRIMPNPIMMRAMAVNTAKKVYFHGNVKTTAEVFLKIIFNKRRRTTVIGYHSGVMSLGMENMQHAKSLAGKTLVMNPTPTRRGLKKPA